MSDNVRDWVGPKIKQLYHSARRNAPKRGIDFSLTIRDVGEAFERQDFVCALTGLPFSIMDRDCRNRRPWAPSIDRIDSMEGYTKENIRIVCNIVNCALNSFGDDAFWQMVRAAHMQAVAPSSDNADLRTVCMEQAEYIKELEAELAANELRRLELVRPWAENICEPKRAESAKFSA